MTASLYLRSYTTSVCGQQIYPTNDLDTFESKPHFGLLQSCKGFESINRLYNWLHNAKHSIQILKYSVKSRGFEFSG